VELIFAPVTRNQVSSTPEQKAFANEHLSTYYYPTDVLNEGQPAAGGVTHNTGAALCCCDSCHLAY
jgi:hypothetical protein